MGAGDDIEAVIGQLFAVVGGGVLQLIPQRSALLQHVEQLQAGPHNGRGQGVGEQVGAASLAEQVDDLLAPGGIAAGSPAKGLAQGAGDNVNPALHAVVLRRSAAVFAHKSHRVAVVHHDQGVVPVGQVADALQIADNAVHGEHAVGGDEFDSGPKRICIL